MFLKCDQKHLSLLVFDLHQCLTYYSFHIWTLCFPILEKEASLLRNFRLNGQHILFLWKVDFVEKNEPTSLSKCCFPVSCLHIFWLKYLLKNKFIENHVLWFCWLVFHVTNCTKQSNISTTVQPVSWTKITKRVTKHIQKCKKLHQDKSLRFTLLPLHLWLRPYIVCQVGICLNEFQWFLILWNAWC